MISIDFANNPHTAGPEWPNPEQATRAAAWAASHGDYRIAQQLMGLAAALDAAHADLEAPLEVRCTACGHTGRPRLSMELSHDLDATAVMADPADAHTERISHAPTYCQSCLGVIAWRKDRWLHVNPADADGVHDALPRAISPTIVDRAT